MIIRYLDPWGMGHQWIFCSLLQDTGHFPAASPGWSGQLTDDVPRPNHSGLGLETCREGRRSLA